MPTALGPLRWHAFHLPKRGHSEEEYEDAFAASGPRSRFAVADGASESSFAGLWARLLAEGFVASRSPWEETGWLEPLRRRWADEVGTRPLPWYAEAKREEGAFATLLGLALRTHGHWRAVAVGDSCLVQLRGGRLVTSFPLGRSDDFGNQPPLLGSRAPAPRAALRRAHGRWQPGDRFLLMTDALAQWFLRQHEQDRQPWDRLQPLLTTAAPAADFAALVDELREGEEMRNDDVTLLTTEPQSPPRERAPDDGQADGPG
jgi:Protein phosphatase 2C